MINPERLESTARMLFGGVEANSNQRSPEPYFTKFVDIRLQLQAPDYHELVALQLADIEPIYRPLQAGDTAYFQASSMIEGAAHLLARQMFSPREVERLFQLIEMTLTIADSPEVDIRRLFVGALSKFRGSYQSHQHRDGPAANFTVDQNTIQQWQKQLRTTISHRRQVLAQKTHALDRSTIRTFRVEAGSVKPLLTREELAEINNWENQTHTEDETITAAIQDRLERLGGNYHRDLLDAALEIISDESDYDHDQDGSNDPSEA